MKHHQIYRSYRLYRLRRLFPVALTAVMLLFAASVVYPATVHSVSGPFSLTWDYATPDERLTGFMLYLPPGDPIDIPDPMARAITLEVPSGIYDVSLTAIGSGVESEPSNTVRVYVDVPLPPPGNVVVTDPITPPVTIYVDEVPEETLSEGRPVDLGLRFEVSVPGQITHLRYYHPANDTTVHTGRLWDAQGALVASAEFTQFVPGEWAEVALEPPVDAFPGDVFTVSADTADLWPGTRGYIPPVNDALTPLANCFTYSVGSFPGKDSTFAAYFRDVVFQPEQ